MVWRYFIGKLNRTSVLAGGLVCAGFLVTAPLGQGIAEAQTLSVRLGGGTLTRAVVRPGTTLTVTTNLQFAELVVGAPDTADVVPLSESSFYIQGKKIGTTNVSIYSPDKDLLGVIDVQVRQRAGDIQGVIRAAVPNGTVKVSMAGDSIRLSGKVATAVDRERAIEAAQQFSEKPVISAVEVSATQQVSLEVRVIEARRSAGRDLGLKVRSISRRTLFGSGGGLQINPDDTGAPATFLQPAEPTSGRILSQNSPFGTLVASVLQTAGVSIDIIIDALEQKGLVRRLAQPNLTTVSGEAAEFHAGGEVPIPSSVSESGQVTFTYRRYGVVLKFLPTVLKRDKVNVRIESEISEIDRTLQVNGFPAFTSRQAQTVIELRDGQSFALAGLLQADNNRNIEQLPWLGNVPILGALFRSSSYQKQESELVIVVTPRLVRPAAPDEKLKTPLDNARPSNDPELFLLGLLEVNKDMIRKYRDGEGIVGAYGHHIDLEFEDPYVAKK